MSNKKDILEMSPQEIYDNKKLKLLTKEDLIRLKTMSRKNIWDFPDGTVFWYDALALEPKKYYDLCITIISRSSVKKMCVSLEIKHGAGEIAIDGEKSKVAIFGYLEGTQQYKPKVKTNYGKILVSHLIIERNFLGQEIMVTSGTPGNMGMKIEEISENKRIYHCTEYGLPADFEKLVFSVEWKLAE